MCVYAIIYNVASGPNYPVIPAELPRDPGRIAPGDYNTWLAPLSAIGTASTAMAVPVFVLGTCNRGEWRLCVSPWLPRIEFLYGRQLHHEARAKQPVR